MKDKFSERIKNIESLLNDIESSTFQSELDKSITLSEIQRAVSKLKNNKAPGIDLICNEMIKSSQNILGPCLLKLFNACLSSGTYPECWTDGYILPLYKGGELDNPSNYRGITITGAIGKLFDSVLNVRLDNYLEKYSLIDKTQIGYTKHSRTSDHMFILKCLVDKYISVKGGKLYTCFVDFQKAFDSVIHAGIKFKLLKMGIGSKFYNIVKDMYSKSRSCIKVKEGLTNFIDLNLGVRQGDNLSPALFKIFINDLPKYLDGTKDHVDLGDLTINCLMYADDVVILSTSKTGLQEKLNKLEKFCSDWCLQVNINKTKVVVFNKSGKISKEEFFFEENKLENVHSYRYLGLQFSASGSFTLARANLYNKGLKAYFKLVKDILSFQPSVNTSMHIFDHTVKPVLLYGSEVWGALNPSSPRLRNDVSLDKIYQNIDPDKLNTKFCKFTLGVNKKSSCICRNGKTPFLFRYTLGVNKKSSCICRNGKTPFLFRYCEKHVAFLA